MPHGPYVLILPLHCLSQGENHRSTSEEVPPSSHPGTHGGIPQLVVRRSPTGSSMLPIGALHKWWWESGVVLPFRSVVRQHCSGRRSHARSHSPEWTGASAQPSYQDLGTHACVCQLARSSVQFDPLSLFSSGRIIARSAQPLDPRSRYLSFSTW